MALTSAQLSYAYYVIATVESGCDYGAVNQSDAITLGILQWYGQNAYYLLADVRDNAPDAYAVLSDRLRALVDGGAQTWNYWTGIYLQGNDADSWHASSEIAGNRAVQDARAATTLTASYDQLRSWGLGDDPKTAVFYMSMAHQRPASAASAMGQLGGSPSIETLLQWCLSNSILGAYRNRYQRVYELLASWDGSSEPPDFGQTGGLPSTDPSDDIAAGDLQSTLAYVQAWGDDLVAFGDMSSTSRLLLHNTGRGIWIPVDGTVPSNPSGGSPGTGPVPPSSPDDPAEFPQMRQYWYDNQGRWSYSQGPGRMEPWTSGYTDCSGGIASTVRRFTGDKYAWIGVSTRDFLANVPIVQESRDGHIDMTNIRPGDLILMDLIGYAGSSGAGNVDHVEWYFGGTSDWGVGYGGGPYPHETTNNVESYWVGKVNHLWIARFLD